MAIFVGIMDSDSAMSATRVTGDTYLTIAGPSAGLYKDKGSRFLAFAYPIYSEADVKPFVDALKMKHHDARHHCYAWRLGMTVSEGGERFRVNDDGEPAGTAGRPIYGQILSRGLTNLLVVVVRYFGGIKLGVPGLIAAYKEATMAVLEESSVVERTENRVIAVEFSYLVMNGVMRVIKEIGPRVVGQSFDNVCAMRLEVRLGDAEELVRRLSEVEGAVVEVVDSKGENISLS